MIQPNLDSVSPTDGGSNGDDIIARIRNKLALVIPDPRHIEIRVNGGVVTLSGALQDSAQRRAATMITHRVDGVTNVVNKLTIGTQWALRGALLRPASPRRTKPAARRVARPAAVPND